MKYLSKKYEKIFTYEELDICTLKTTPASAGDHLGYVIDHKDFAGQEFNLVEDAIKSIKKKLNG